MQPNMAEAKYWNSPATRAWVTRHETIDRLFEEITRAAMEAAGIAKGEQVLDVGCGSGTTVLELAARVGPQGRVLGADISEEFVKVASRRIEESGLRNAQAVVADASTADFDTRFDLMFSRFGVMFFTDPRTSFVNLRRAMKPGGRITFAVWRTQAENGWMTAAPKAIAHLVPAAPPYEPEAPGPCSWADPARVHRILEGAGFRDVSLTPRDFSLKLAPKGESDAAADFAMNVGPVVRALGDANEAMRVKIRAALESYFRGIESAEGVVLPGAIWIVKANT